MNQNRVIQHLKSMIGNTPLLEIHFTYKGKKRTIFAKAENLNMTGSIKDRMAYHIISEGYKVGKHRIQGISDEFIPDICPLKQLDDIISVDDGDAIIMAQKLSAQLGLAVGISSGANFLGALLVQEKLGADKNVVTIFSDDNKKYLSTDLMREEPIKEDFISTDIQLECFLPHKRVCITCCDSSICSECSGHEMDVALPNCVRR